MPNDDFCSLFDLLPIGAYRSSPDGRQLRANLALVQLNGYASELELLAATHNLSQGWYVDPGRREEFRAQLRQHGRVLDFVSEVYRHRTRERIWVREHAHVVHDASGAEAYYEGTVEDISQQQRLLLELQASERRFRAVTEKAQLLTLIYNAKGILTYASPAARTVLGVAPHALQGTHILDWIHPDEVLEVRQEIARILRFENNGLESINRLRHANGSWRYLALLANNCIADEAVQGVVVTGRDVTDAHLAQQRLIESEVRFRNLTEMSSDWYWEMDTQFRFIRLEAGQRVKRLLRDDRVLGKMRREVGPNSLSPAEWDAHDAVLRAHLPFRDFEFERELEDGQRRWHAVSGEPVYDAAGVFCGYRGVGRDITELKQAQETIRRMAFMDPLTGLANRRLLMDRLQQLLKASERRQELSALLFLDLDHLKQVNDRLGHDAGDVVLIQVAQRLKACVRAVDTVARVGGDEFVVLLQDLSDNPAQAFEQARRLAQKILLALAAPYEFSQGQHLGGCSIGLVVIDDLSQDAETWLKRADTAMYQAKAAGRNTLRFSDSGLGHLPAS